MFVVMSNIGNWDRDMVGVIGTVEKEEDLLSLIQKHGEYTDDQIQNAKVVGDRKAIEQTWEDEEFSFFSMGTPVLMVFIGEEDEDYCYGDYYYLETIEQK